MYRERIHLTVRDLAGWNEVIAVLQDLNALAEQLGHPTAVLWTETIGVFNHIVAEIDHDSLASYETNTKALFDHPDFAKHSSRLTAATIEGKGYTELFELATPLGDQNALAPNGSPRP